MNNLCYLILRHLCIYGMLNRIVNPSNNLCNVCFPSIYQSSITLISIPRYHGSSTNISLHIFTLKKISHHITPIQIILSIQLHTHRLKLIISFSSHNQQKKKGRMQKKGKQNTRLQKLNKYLLEVTQSLQKENQGFTLNPSSWIHKSCV